MFGFPTARGKPCGQGQGDQRQICLPTVLAIDEKQVGPSFGTLMEKLHQTSDRTDWPPFDIESVRGAVPEVAQVLIPGQILGTASGRPDVRNPPVV